VGEGAGEGEASWQTPAAQTGSFVQLSSWDIISAHMVSEQRARRAFSSAAFCDFGIALFFPPAVQGQQPSGTAVQSASVLQAPAIFAAGELLLAGADESLPCAKAVPSAPRITRAAAAVNERAPDATREDHIGRGAEIGIPVDCTTRRRTCGACAGPIHSTQLMGRRQERAAFQAGWVGELVGWWVGPLFA
jgi:hypothetical protein